MSDQDIRNFVEMSLRLQREGSEMDMYAFAGLQWTTEPPTKAGWYWAVWGEDEANSGMQVVEVVEGNGFMVSCPEIDFLISLEAFTHWLGSLPEPEMPKV